MFRRGASSREPKRSRRDEPRLRGGVALARDDVPHRYRAGFSPDAVLPADVTYIPYTHAVAEARRRARRAQALRALLCLAVVAVLASELLGGSPRVPWLVGLALLGVLGLLAGVVLTIVQMRPGHPGAAVWRYGVFLWPDAMVVLPAEGPAVVIPVRAIESVEQDREPARVVRVVARGQADDGAAGEGAHELVSVTIDDLGAMPAAHLVQSINGWRNDVEADLHAELARKRAATTRRPPRL